MELIFVIHISLLNKVRKPFKSNKIRKKTSTKLNQPRNKPNQPRNKPFNPTPIVMYFDIR